MSLLWRAVLTALANVLLATVCLLGLTAQDWSSDRGRLVLPEAEGCEWDCCASYPTRIVNVYPARAGTGVEYWLPGKPVTLPALRERLLLDAERRRYEDGWSGTRVLIRADRSVPYSAIRAIFDLCLDPEVRIFCIQFATTRPRAAR